MVDQPVTWGWNHNVSQTVDQYKALNQGKRPVAEFAKTAGGGISIRTGANVTRARTTGISFRRAWPKIKTFVQSVSLLRFAGVGATRRRNADIRHAGYNFDKGINTLVEDIAKGKVKTTEDFARRLEALHDDAKVLMQKGRKSPAAIRKRFEENLTESLAAAMKADTNAGKRVVNFVAHQSSGAFKNFYNAEITDPDLRQLAKNVGADKMSEENLFARSLLPNIRKAAALQGNWQAIQRFDGNSLRAQAFAGNHQKAEAFGGSPSAFLAFGGDVSAFQKFGESYKLFGAFGNDPNVLKGGNGAEILSNWMDQTYGNGSGQKFLETNPKFQNGINTAHQLSELGNEIGRQLEPYAGKDYDYSDIETDKIVARDNEALANEFDIYATKERNKENLDWLRDLQDVRDKVDTQDVEITRAAIKNLATRTLADGGKPQSEVYVNNFGSLEEDAESDKQDMNVSHAGRRAITRAIHKAANQKYQMGARLSDSLRYLDDMSKDQLKMVLEGFGNRQKSGTAVCDVAGNVGDLITRFQQQNTKSITRNADLDVYKQYAENICAPMFGPGIGSRIVDDYVSKIKENDLEFDTTQLDELEELLYNPPPQLLQGVQNPDNNPLLV